MSSAMEFLKHQSRKDLQKMAKEWGIKANLRSEDIRYKLVAEGFTAPSSGGTVSGDQPENCAPESPRTNSVDSKTGSAGDKARRRRAALHVRNEADAVVRNEAARTEQQPATQQRSCTAKPRNGMALIPHKATPAPCRASTATQYFTPCASSPIDLTGSPATFTVGSPAMKHTPPAPPAHLQHTPHKAAATPSKPRRQAPTLAKARNGDAHTSKCPKAAWPSPDQLNHSSTTVPLADITAEAQPTASQVQCIADMPSTAAALQRLKQTRTHGRAKSAPALPPHLKHQSPSASPPLDPTAAPVAATASATGKSRPRTAMLSPSSKSSKLALLHTPQRPSLALSLVPQHLSKRSDRSRRSGAADSHTILSARSKRTAPASEHRHYVKQHAAATAAAANQSMAAVAAAAAHVVANCSAQTAAIQQQLQQMTSGGRHPSTRKSTHAPTISKEKSTPSMSSCSARKHHCGLQRADPVPTSAPRSGHASAQSSVEIISISDTPPSAAPAVDPSSASHGEGRPSGSASRAQRPANSGSGGRCPLPIIEEPPSPSPPARCLSPITLASPTLPSHPAVAAAHVPSNAVSGSSSGRHSRVAPSHERTSVVRPPAAPPGGKSRRTTTQDSNASAADTSSGGNAASGAEAHHAAAQPAGPSLHVRVRDRTPSRTPARRRNSPSKIVHAIHHAGQVRTRPTQAATDTSDPRQRTQSQAAPASRSKAAEERKQVELDSALRQLQPPQLSSDGEHMSASDDDEAYMDHHARAGARASGRGGHAGRRWSQLQRSASAGAAPSGRARLIPDFRVSERQREAPAVAGLESCTSVASVPELGARQSSVQELLQLSPHVLRRRSVRRRETVEWMQERSRQLDELQESMQVLTLSGRSGSAMSAEAPFPGSGGRSRLRTSGSSLMDSDGLSTSVDQFLLAERAAAVAANMGTGRVGSGGREGVVADPQRGRAAAGQARRTASRSPLPRSAAHSLSPVPMKRKDAPVRSGPTSARPRLGAPKGGGGSSGSVGAAHSGSAHSGSSASSMAGVDAVSAAASTSRQGADAGGFASAQGSSAPASSKGPSPYMASPMAQKAQPKAKSTVGALRTPSVQPRVAMMACQRKRA
eukprot:jgi/Ulvmu1/7944/UM004_0177.1